jgi:hypothetical protein
MVYRRTVYRKIQPTLVFSDKVENYFVTTGCMFVEYQIIRIYAFVAYS